MQPDAPIRDVPGHEGRYGATADGRIWSYPRRQTGKIERQHGGRWLTAANPDGRYDRVTLTMTDGTWRSLGMHRLVAAAWLERPSGKTQVNHLNGDKTDNRAINLEWCTAAENQQHAIRTGLRRPTAKQREAGERLAVKIKAAAVLYHALNDLASAVERGAAFSELASARQVLVDWSKAGEP